MFIAIANAIGSNRRSPDKIQLLIDAFKVRVLADGGTFEAESCLKTQLESLNLTYPVTFVSSPVISGSTSVGSTITTTNGVVNGITPITYTYQWLLDGSPILGATSSTYTTTNIGTLTCIVTGTNIYGAVSQVSNSLNIAFDADYQAILDYATTLGYTLPSVSQRLKQSILLSSLKTAGVWSKLDTFANFATDGSSNFALIDWKRLVLYTAVNSPAFTTNKGFTGNGTSSYINTNFNPATQGVNYTQNNASRYAYLSNSVAGATNMIDGTINDSNLMVRGNVAYQRINQSISNLNTVFDFTNGIGLKSIHRTSSTNVELFNDNTQSSRLANSSTLASVNQWILRHVNFYGTSQISMYAMGASLVSENNQFNTAINNYITSL